MGVPTIKTGPMTVEEYFAFTDTRPDNEKWELIDGEPILNASPSGLHQRILWNLAILLRTIERRQPQSWEATPGIGVRVSDTKLPEPDVFILPAGTIRRDPYSKETRDVLVAFEILSPSTAERDLRWKRTAYTSLPSLTHYVVIAQDAVEWWCSRATPDSRSGACDRSPIRSNCRRRAFRCRWRRFIATPICDSD